MKSAFAWLAFVLALLAPELASAANWVKFHEDASGAYYFDTTSPGPKGDMAFAMSKFIPRQPYVERRLDNKTVYVEFSAHVFNCANQSYALAAFSAYDQAGKLVGRRETTDKKDLKFIKTPPGSLLDELAGRACTMAREQAALKPAVLAGSIFSGDWRAISTNSAGAATFYREDSLHWISATGFTVIIRADFPRGATLSPEYPNVYHLISLTTFDCSRGIYVANLIDGYDSDGQLIFSGPDRREKPIGSGTMFAMFTQSKCSAPGARTAEAAPPSPAGQAGGDAGKTEAAEPALSTGTAWLTSKGYLVTAAHVVAGGKSIAVAQDGKPVGEAEVVVSDTANDVAILKPKFKGGLHPAIALAATPAELGESIFTLGYPAPDLMGLSLKLTTGTVNATSGTDVRHDTIDDARLIQFSAPVQAGNSGGPVIDRRGHAVGLVVTKASQISEHEVAENVNYALKVRYVNALLSELPDLGAYRTVTAQGASLTTLAKELRGAVFMLVVELDDDAQAASSDQR